MLLLVDLDNTLIDRASAFQAWAGAFILSLGRSPSEVAWLVEADEDGYRPRESLARAVKARLGLATDVETLVERLLFEHVDWMEIDADTTRALAEARDHGWRIAVVTNGTTAQQTAKIRKVGLETYVDAVVISESEGVKKPDLEIFAIAARRLGGVLAGNWMVGDHPVADIAGGHAAGLTTGWVSRGSEWPTGSVSPTITAHRAAEVIDAIRAGG